MTTRMIPLEWPFDDGGVESGSGKWKGRGTEEKRNRANIWKLPELPHQSRYESRRDDGNNQKHDVLEVLS
jgi:hypothetical protein